MKLAPTTMRSVVPAILALGAVALLWGPLSASTASAEAQAPTHGTARVQAPAAPPDIAANTRVSIGAVAFPAEVAVADGRLRTPVLLAADGVSASAQIAGAAAGPGCTADLTVGVPAWLDCTLVPTPGDDPRVVVTLSDGRTATKAIAAG